MLLQNMNLTCALKILVKSISILNYRFELRLISLRLNSNILMNFIGIIKPYSMEK